MLERRNGNLSQHFSRKKRSNDRQLTKNDASRRSCEAWLCRTILLFGVLSSFVFSVLLVSWHEHSLAVPGVYHHAQEFSLIDQIQEIPKNSNAKLDQQPGNGARKQIWPATLGIYMEPSSSYDIWYKDSSHRQKVRHPLPRRNIRSDQLKYIPFPNINYTSDQEALVEPPMCTKLPSLLPIDDFGTVIMDPYLPWIHDVFISHDYTKVHIIAQNRRRCHKGKHHLDEMKFWEGQVALFQPVALKRVVSSMLKKQKIIDENRVQYRLSSYEEADSDALETRFICRFKSLDYDHQTVQYESETLSVYPFNYEFVNWRKKKPTMVEDGKEQSYFWLSPLMFDCPLPEHLQYAIRTQDWRTKPGFLLDIVPIRTPVRRNDVDGFFFHSGHGGPATFNASISWGSNHILPEIEDSGRWENIPLCVLKEPTLAMPAPVHSGEIAASKSSYNDAKNVQTQYNRGSSTSSSKKPHRLVACTWTSSLHQRRGNERRITDGKSRLREWIAFHLQAGFDHIYVFDNSGANSTIFRLKNEKDPDRDGNDARNLRNHDDLSSITNLFPASQVTRIDWPATICNNNRPAHDDPGERSSQYAAEAACRLRFGPYTDWMASMDPDEYFVPMGNYTSWKPILDKIDVTEGRKILKFRSTRARPILKTLVPIYDEGTKECTREMGKSSNRCLTKKQENTYLETYNCEYIKSPKPERFARAMKQIYRPDFVLSHFVHYSTVTTDLAAEKQNTEGDFIREMTTNSRVERFVDELREGVLIHAKTTVPAETFSRDKMCKLNSPSACLVGIPCPENLPFDDALHKKNIFHNEKGEYCNCWMNRKVEEYWLPKLKAALDTINREGRHS